MTPRPAIPPPVEQLAGSTFGKYEIVHKLATGGMAELYLARVRGAAGFEKTVVLKRMLPRIAEDPESVAMFLQEARLAATLQHPNIADVYDVGEAYGSYFFTMEYIHGADARAIAMTAALGKKPVPLAVSTAIVLGTAMALDHAHQRRVIHRDVSPSNILVSFDGAVKLVDFGIARASSSDKLTQTGTVKGKIPYMSPEQCQSRVVDLRTDLFSLGVVLYELTLGRRPFVGDSDYEVMCGIVEGQLALPSSIDPSYPRELELIVTKLLARDVKIRYQTADACVHDLETFIASNNLWQSAKSLSKYMRTLFPDSVDAWERAAQQGISLDDHLLATASLRTGSVPDHTVQTNAFAGKHPDRSIRAAGLTPTDHVQPAGWASRRVRTIALSASGIVLAFALGSIAFGRDSEPATANVPASVPEPAPEPIAEPIAPAPAPQAVPAAAALAPAIEAARPPAEPTAAPSLKRVTRTKPARASTTTKKPATTETSCDSNSPFWPGRSSERCQQPPTPNKTRPR
ncbi:MAG: serine/threonine protein kinase [Kofleriaceae bacterium]